MSEPSAPPQETKALSEWDTFVLTDDHHSMMLYCRNHAMYDEAKKLADRVLTNERLNNPVYRQFIENYAICLYYDGKVTESYGLFCLLIRNFYNESNENIKRYHYNRHFCVPKVFRLYEDYPIEIIKRIKPDTTGMVPEYTFTITTCKRLDLFKRTMNSFLNCCKDFHLIDRWICIDDNSSQSDRDEMKRLYPFFEFYFKTPEEKGHANSMNILFDMISRRGTRFVFHMEDDWEYFEPKNYLTLCTEVLGTRADYGQCLINRDYIETETTFSCRGSELKYTGTGMRYYEHVHSPGHHNFPNCMYWKHYSLRPSLLKWSVLKQVGRYNPIAGHFESEYADRYYSLGFRSAFLEDFYSYHIGKLTHQKDIPNAYTLNQEKQFGQIQGFDINRMKAKIINLDRRPERWESFSKQPWPLSIPPSKFSAADGQKVTSSTDLVRVFKHNDFKYRIGIVGCALSHIKLWCDLLEDVCDYYLILEDDAEFTSYFTQENIIRLMTQLDNIEVLYLGHHPNNTEEKDRLNSKEEIKIVTRKSDESFKTSWGGTFGYIVSETGARKLLDWINTYSVTNGIDWVMMKSSNVVRCQYIHPSMVKSECFIPSSDIHHDYTGVVIDQFHQEDFAEYLPKKDGKYNIDHILPIDLKD